VNDELESMSELRTPTGLLLFIPQVIYDYGELWWNDIDRRNRGTWRKAYPSANLPITNPTWTDPGANLGLCGERVVTNSLGHGMAI
jgi:hypothetical protein